MTSKKLIMLAVLALCLILLFAALFGEKSLFKTREMILKNAELEESISDVSYKNARLGKSYKVTENISDSDYDSFYRPSGNEFFAETTTARKVLISLGCSGVAVFIVLLLLVLRKRRISLSNNEAIDDESDDNSFFNKRNAKDAIFDDKVVDMRTKEGLNKVCDTIAVGGVAIIPCDTVYGFCSLVNDAAKERITAIKERDPNKNFIVVATMQKAKHLLGKNITNDLYSLWPSPLTIIGYRAGNGDEKIAVRVPNDDKLNNVLNCVGAMYSTSVNISGEPPLDDIRAIKARFGERVDIIGYDPDKVFSAPSTILDASVFPFKIVRQGAYPRKDLEEKISLQD